MAPTVFLSLLESLPPYFFTALALMITAKEIGIGFATVVTLVGVVLCWEAPRHRMLVEERAKDGELTEDQARRRIRGIAWFGPVVAFAGMALLCGILLR
jgi:hypothetical protein